MVSDRSHRSTSMWARALCSPCALGFAVVLACHSASAQTEVDDNRVVARRMAEEAANQYEAGDFDKARDLFHRANVLYPAPTLELWEARALDKLGRLVEAEELYSAVQRYQLQAEDPDVVRSAVREAGDEVVRLRRRIPTVTIALRGADPNDPSVEVQLDNRRVNPAMLGFPRPIDPGEHAAVLYVNGRERRSVSIQAAEGDRKSVELDATETPAVPAAPVPPPPPAHRDIRPADRGIPRESPWYVQRTTGWITAGIGAAGVAAGVATGLAAMNKYHDLEKHCVDGACPEDYADEHTAFRKLTTLSTVCYVVGGVGVAAGVAILVLVPAGKTSSDPAPVAVAVGPMSASFMAAF
jgi:hypothetical protein